MGIFPDYLEDKSIFDEKEFLMEIDLSFMSLLYFFMKNFMVAISTIALMFYRQEVRTTQYRCCA